MLGPRFILTSTSPSDCGLSQRKSDGMVLPFENSPNDGAGKLTGEFSWYSHEVCSAKDEYHRFLATN